MQHRPQYHFTPESNWMNDPNGLVYFEGEYHLFYQYHPDSIDWGPMHWGHAVSREMVHWEELPIALYPDPRLGYIFSGCVVLDWQNTSGLGKNEKPPMIAIFTNHNFENERAGDNYCQYQSIAVSNDKGRSWTMFEGNPVLTNPGAKDFRDPKVIWHEASGKWVMVLAVYNRVMIYNSPNLIDWTFASEFGIARDTRIWECPDLFPLVVEDSKEIKWVLLVSIQKEGPNGGSATSYFIGDFNGQTFVTDDSSQRWIDYGKDNYAMVTWSDIPVADGRCLALGWMSNWQYAESIPTKTWRGAMTLPRELTLHRDRNHYRIRSMPIKELNLIEKEITKIIPQNISGPIRIDLEPGSRVFRIELKFENPGNGRVGVRLSNNCGEYLDVSYYGADKLYCVDRTNAGKSDFSEAFAGAHFGNANYDKDDVLMIIYVDVSSVELFADNGRCVMTELFFPSAPFDSIEIQASEIPVVLKEGYLSILQQS